MTTIEQRIKFLLDSGSQSKTIKGIKDLRRELENAGNKAEKAFLRGELSADDYRKEIKRVEDEVKQLDRALDRLEKPRIIDVNTDNFDRVSRDVSLIGDADAAFATTGGALDFFGASGAGRGAQGAAEVLAVTEALPRLKASVRGLPASARAAAQEIGIGGFGLIGAIVALTAVTKLAQAAQEERTEVAQGRINALLNVNDLERKSNAELIDLRQEYLDELQNSEEDLATARQVTSGLIDGANEKFGIFGRVILEAGNATGVAATELGVARDRVEDLSGTTIELQDNLDTVNKLLEERNVIDEKTIQNLLSEAALAGQLESARLQADELGIEALEDQIKASQDRKSVLEAELAVLKASGDTSEQVSQRIEQLTQQISNLGQEIGIFETERPEAQARTDAIEAQKEAEKAATEAEREREKQLRESESAAQKAANAQASYNDKLADIGQSLRDSLQDAGIDEQRSLQDLARDFRRDELKAEREFNRDIKGIRDDARRDETQALRGRDFASLFEGRESIADNIVDATEQFRAETEERLIEAKESRIDIVREAEQQRRDLRREAQRQRRDANQQLQNALLQERGIRVNAYRATINDAQQWAQQFRNAITSGLGSGGGGTTNNNFDSRLRDAFRGQTA